jgi:hypothetical protein
LGLITDPFYFYAYSRASETWEPSIRLAGWIIAVAWYLFTKVVKRIGLLRRHPADIVFIPVSMVFGFCHGFIKMLALWTWNEVSLRDFASLPHISPIPTFSRRHMTLTIFSPADIMG